MNDRAKIITFDCYYDPMLAQIIYGKLRANRISCFIADDNMLWAKPYFNQALGGIKIKIFEKDLEKCREILAVLSDLQIDNEISTGVACSFCASHNVRYGQSTEFRFHLLSLLVSIFIFVPVYFRNAWHCFNCHRDFD